MKTELIHTRHHQSVSPFNLGNTYHIIIVDDEAYYNKLLWQTLVNVSNDLGVISNKRIDIATYSDGYNFIKDIEEEKYNDSRLIVFLDYFLNDSLRGIEVLNKLMQLNPKPKVVVVSSVRSKETSIETINAGAYAFLSKNSCTPLVCRILLEQLLLE